MSKIKELIEKTPEYGTYEQSLMRKGISLTLQAVLEDYKEKITKLDKEIDKFELAWKSVGRQMVHYSLLRQRDMLIDLIEEIRKHLEEMNSQRNLSTEGTSLDKSGWTNSDTNSQETELDSAKKLESRPDENKEVGK